MDEIARVLVKILTSVGVSGQLSFFCNGQVLVRFESIA